MTDRIQVSIKPEILKKAESLGLNNDDYRQVLTGFIQSRYAALQNTLLVATKELEELKMQAQQIQTKMDEIDGYLEYQKNELRDSFVVILDSESLHPNYEENMIADQLARLRKKGIRIDYDFFTKNYENWKKEQIAISPHEPIACTNIEQNPSKIGTPCTVQNPSEGNG
jgi:uncharacterized protein YfkK (UPF0435 family)